MKKNIKFIFTIIIFINSIGCFEDDGNYDYTKIATVQIELPYTTYLVVNDTFQFKPIIKLDRELLTNVNYEWQINNKIVSTDSVYTHKAKELGYLQGLLTIQDKASGAKYYKVFKIDVRPLFEMGFLLLTENGENSDLGFIKATAIPRNPQTGTNDTITYIADYKNCYSNLFSEPIKGKPICLKEHYALNDYVSVYGEVTVQTELDGKYQFIELNGESLQKETSIEDEFLNGILPTSFHPTKLIHTCYDSFLLDENGSVYTRRCDPATGYHLGFFSKDVSLWGNKYPISNVLFSDYARNTTMFVTTRDNNSGMQKYRGVYSNTYSIRNNLSEMKLKYNMPAFADHFENFTEEIIESDYFQTGISGNSGNAVIQKNDAGDYILHLFAGGATNRTQVEITSSQKINLTQEHGIRDFVKLGTLRNCNMVYICDKHKIYFIEIDFNFHKYKFGIVKEFDKEIVSMATQSMFRYGENSYEHHIGVAFSDGFFDIYEMQYSNKDATCLQKFSNKVYSSSQSFGKIKDVIWKVGISNYYFYM